MSDDNCAECGSELPRGRRGRKFCSPKCRYRFRDRIRYATNPEPIRARAKAWYWANHERALARDKATRAARRAAA
jgi:hypothetical protein